MGQYMTWLAENRGLAFDSYAQLWEWSVTDLAGFWASIWDFFEVHAQTPYQGVLASPTMPGAVWFPGAHLNYAEHALRSTGDRMVVVSVSQTRNTIELSAEELRDQVARVRAGLVRLGVGRGDRVAAYLPNVAEAVVAVPCGCQPWGYLVLVRPGVRHAECHRPLATNRARGAAHHRRLPQRLDGD